MMRLFFLLFLSGQLAAGVLELPKYSDFNRNQFPYSPIWGYSAFNGANEFGIVFNHLKTQYGLEVVVETGTYKGHTTAFFASVFPEVHTIEIEPISYAEASSFLSPFSHVKCHLGSSETVLHSLLPTLHKKRVLFYLDAHWNAYWPLRDELKEISLSHPNNCIIVIDDFKVPARKDIGFDSYGPHECSLAYVSDLLKEIFPDGCSTHFLIPKNLASRAKLVVIPNAFKEMATVASDEN